MSDTDIAVRIICSLLSSIFVINIIARIVGEDRKKKWFKKRTKFSVFNMRGILGERFHFGRPCTLQGLGVTVVMLSCVALVSYIVFIV